MLNRASRPARTLAHVQKTLVDRREFIRWVGGIAVLTACSRNPLSPADPSSTAPATPRLDPALPTGALNVREYGAVGDGITNETAAFARAMSAIDPAGGTLFVPPGVYLIDPLQSVCLRDNTTLWLDSEAILQAIPVYAAFSAVVLVKDVKNAGVTGGTIIGERNGHLGTLGEQGFGIWIQGSTGVRIHGVTVRDCWGDGILIGGSRLNGECRDVTVSKCTSRNNRRQGLSVLGLFGGLIQDSEFSGTNGTSPQSGIDVEPSGRLSVTDLTIRNCITERNAGWGILVCGNQKAAGIGTSRIRVESNRSADNVLDGIIVMRGVTESVVVGNTVARNNLSGIKLESSSVNDVRSNHLTNNSRQTPHHFPSILLVHGSSDNLIEENTFDAPQRRLIETAGPDIVVGTGDCLRNVIANNGRQRSTVNSKAPTFGPKER